MRTINQFVIHHSASKRSIKTSTIKKWHLDKGWNDIAYHYCIEEDGKIVKGRNDDVIGAHAKGNNRNTLGICIICDNTITNQKMNQRQKDSLYMLLAVLTLMHPNANVTTHKNVMPEGYTDCPGFNRQMFYPPSQSHRLVI